MLTRLNPWRGLGGLPRAVWILFTVTLVNRMGSMVLAFLVLYLTKDVGFSEARAGFVLALYGAGALVAAPLAGRLCDRLGAERVMTASLILAAITMLFYPLARSWSTIIVATFVLAFVSESVRPASMSIMAEVVAPHERKKAFAVARLAINLGMSIGPALGGLLAMHSFRALFWVDGATSLAAGLVLIIWPLRRAAHTAHTDASAAVMPPAAGAALSAAAPTPVAPSLGDAPDAAPPRARPVSPPAARDRRFILFLLAMVPVGMVFFQHMSAMSLFMVHTLGLPERAYGLMFTINTAIIVLLEVRLNLATEHWPHRNALALGAVLVAVGFGALAFCRDVVSVAASVVVWTFGEMILFPALSAQVADMAPADRRGEYMGLYTMAFSVAFILGPWLGTTTLAHLGGNATWGGAFALAILSAVLMAKAASRRPAAAEA